MVSAFFFISPLAIGLFPGLLSFPLLFLIGGIPLAPIVL